MFDSLLQQSVIKYDLHLHSCLSPCGDNENTPAMMVGLCKLNGLEIMAVTDHNSTRNCRYAVEAGRFYEILVVPGMELCVAEEAHVVCLFDSLDGAEGFGQIVYDRMLPILNEPDIFGDQRVVDTDGNVVDTVDKLLINACDIPIYEVPDLVREYGGFAFPAHLDKSANSVVSNLGLLTEDMGFTVGEFADMKRVPAMIDAGLVPENLKTITNSDAHYLKDIKEPSEGEYLPSELKNLFSRLIQNEYS